MKIQSLKMKIKLVYRISSGCWWTRSALCRRNAEGANGACGVRGAGASSPYLSFNRDTVQGGRIAELRKKDRLRGNFESKVTGTVPKKCCELVTKDVC